MTDAARIAVWAAFVILDLSHFDWLGLLQNGGFGNEL